jgi:FliA/WhiG family RNA polymerase sigma factor
MRRPPIATPKLRSKEIKLAWQLVGGLAKNTASGACALTVSSRRNGWQRRPLRPKIFNLSGRNTKQIQKTLIFAIDLSKSTCPWFATTATAFGNVLPDGVELDDLISAGIFGLMDAIDAFDTGRGVKFETYCVPRIRGAMLDELRSMDWVPRLVRSKASKLGEAKKRLEARYGRAPTEREISEYMEISVAEVEKMQQEANAVNLVSLNKKWYETDSYKDVREIDILEDKKGEDPTRRVQKSDLMRLGHQRAQSQRTLDHHPVLLRRVDDERDRGYARS